MKNPLNNSRGMALVVIIFIGTILLTLTGASLLFSGLNLKTAANFKNGSGALHAADAGIQHALTLIPTGTTFSYSSQTTLVSGNPFVNGYSYTVTALNDSASSGGNTQAILTSTATGPNNSVRRIQAYVGRSLIPWTPPGALYIPGSQYSTFEVDFSGASYTVNGNDTNYDNTSGPNPAISGISSHMQNVVDTVKSTLNTDAKRQTVTGAGYAAGPPVTPSVQTTTRTDDIAQMAQNFVNQVTASTCPPKCLSGLSRNSTTCPQSNPCTLGTDANPQITYIKGETNLSGYVNGSGVLVLEGETELGGNFNFHGLVIQRQTPGVPHMGLEMEIQGNAQIYGSLMLGPNNDELEFEIENSAAIRYSSQAINMVTSRWGSCCLQASAPPRLIAWQEVMQ